MIDSKLKKNSIKTDKDVSFKISYNKILFKISRLKSFHNKRYDYSLIANKISSYQLMFFSLSDFLAKKIPFGIESIRTEFRVCTNLECSSNLPDLPINLENDKIKFQSILKNQAFYYTILNNDNIKKDVSVYLDINTVTSKNVKIYQHDSSKKMIIQSNNSQYYIDLSTIQSFNIINDKNFTRIEILLGMHQALPDNMIHNHIIFSNTLSKNVMEQQDLYFKNIRNLDQTQQNYVDSGDDHIIEYTVYSNINTRFTVNYKIDRYIEKETDPKLIYKSQTKTKKLKIKFKASKIPPGVYDLSIWIERKGSNYMFDERHFKITIRSNKDTPILNFDDINEYYTNEFNIIQLNGALNPKETDVRDFNLYYQFDDAETRTNLIKDTNIKQNLTISLNEETDQVLLKIWCQIGNKYSNTVYFIFGYYNKVELKLSDFTGSRIGNSNITGKIQAVGSNYSRDFDIFYKIGNSDYHQYYHKLVTFDPFEISIENIQAKNNDNTLSIKIQNGYESAESTTSFSNDGNPPELQIIEFGKEENVQGTDKFLYIKALVRDIDNNNVTLRSYYNSFDDTHDIIVVSANSTWTEVSGNISIDDKMPGNYTIKFYVTNGPRNSNDIPKTFYIISSEFVLQINGIEVYANNTMNVNLSMKPDPTLLSIKIDEIEVIFSNTNNYYTEDGYFIIPCKTKEIKPGKHVVTVQASFEDGSRITRQQTIFKHYPKTISVDFIYHFRRYLRKSSR